MIETIDTLIEKYPKIFEDYEGNPGRVNWDCPKGWLHILDWLCGALQSYIDNTEMHDNDHQGGYHPPQIRCMQVQEKYADLRFYTDGYTDVQDGMIRFAEYLASITCQNRGSMEEASFVNDHGWYSILCKKCQIKNIPEPTTPPPDKNH